jgi:general stress protein 26
MKFEASRPFMPGYGIAPADAGQGLLPWSWAEQRLSNGHNYWLSTVSAEGRPHTMPVWGVWIADAFAFSTGTLSRKARNLAHNTGCTIAIESGVEALVVEGTATLVHDAAKLAAISKDYTAKYGSGYPEDSHVFSVVPEVVFALIESLTEFGETTTRWRPVRR